MNPVSKILSASHVLLDLEISSKKRLFEQIGLTFENENRIARATVFDALFTREKLGSTGLGLGVAIPHGRIKQLRDTVAVFVRSKEGIPFDSPDGEPVSPSSSSKRTTNSRIAASSAFAFNSRSGTTPRQYTEPATSTTSRTALV